MMQVFPRPEPASEKQRSSAARGRNTNDHYIKHPPLHFDQNVLEPQRALPLLTSEFINPVRVTAWKHKIHWPPCSPTDLTVCLPALPSLPDCSLGSLRQHSHSHKCTGSWYDAPRGARPGNCSHQPRRLPAVHTHTSAMIVMASKWFAPRTRVPPQEAAGCCAAVWVGEGALVFVFSWWTVGPAQSASTAAHQPWKEGFLWNRRAAALPHCAPGAPASCSSASVSLVHRFKTHKCKSNWI